MLCCIILHIMLYYIYIILCFILLYCSVVLYCIGLSCLVLYGNIISNCIVSCLDSRWFVEIELWPYWWIDDVNPIRCQDLVALVFSTFGFNTADCQSFVVSLGLCKCFLRFSWFVMCEEQPQTQVTSPESPFIFQDCEQFKRLGMITLQKYLIRADSLLF